jgi:hypothetical protein
MQAVAASERPTTVDRALFREDITCVSLSQRSG